MSRKFLNAVTGIMADFRKREGRTMQFGELLAELEKRKAPEISTVNREGKPIYFGDKLADSAAVFRRVLRQVERGAMPGKKHADENWVKACAKLREKLAIVGGARGRAADLTPAPSIDLEELL